LSALQAANYVLPLITLPYLVRVLGIGGYGIVAFTQAFTNYFLIFTDYGFQLSATREVSLHRDDKNKLSEIFSSVTAARCLLGFAGFLILSALLFFVPKLGEEWLIFIFAYGAIVGNIMFPAWMFQGLERMKYVAALNIAAKLIFTFAIFFFIKQRSDYYLVPLLTSTGFVAAGIIALWVIFFKLKIKFYFPKLKIVWYYIKESTDFFLSRASVSLYTSSNIFFLGLFVNTVVAGYYAIAEKIYIALQCLYQPLITILYPYMANTKNIKQYRLALFFATAVNIVLAGILFVGAGLVLRVIFGSGIESSIGVLRILLIASLVVVPSIIMGYPLLAALGHAKYANYSVIVGSVFHFVVLIILAFCNKLNIYNVALLVLATESMVFAIRVYGTRRYRLLSQAI
jgi:PST family polysaccharide transporter